MTPRLGAFLVVLAVTGLTTLVATPLCRRLALRAGAIVAPDERRVHERPTPLLGGLAMGIGLLAGMLTASRLEALGPIFSGTSEPVGVVVAAVLMLAVGTVDDVREVSPPAKVAGIVLCASVLVYAGVSMIVFRIPGVTVFVLSTDWSYLFSVLWVLGMTNAINLIDGLDGLAAGIVGIASATFFLYTLDLVREGIIPDGNIGPLLAIITLGLCLGYLPFNFHPAKIFMGDGGALLLGLLVAASTMVVGGRVGPQTSTPAQSYFFFAPLFIPLLILGVPILDSALAIVRRARRHSGVATADKEHIHHRLMALGHGQRRSVLILWAWTCLLSAMVLFPPYTGRGSMLIAVGVAALGLTIYTVRHPVVRSVKRRDGDGGVDDGTAEPQAGGDVPVGAPEPSAPAKRTG